MNARPNHEQILAPASIVERDERWVTCTRYESWAAARYRHRIKKGRGVVTTLCGAMATMASVWKHNTRKIKCPACERRATPGYLPGSD